MAIIVGLTQPGRPHERFRDRGDRPPPLAVRCGAAPVVGERGGPGAGRLPRGAKPRGWVAGAAAPGKNHRPPSLLLLRSWPVGLGRPLARGHAARARLFPQALCQPRRISRLRGRHRWQGQRPELRSVQSSFRPTCLCERPPRVRRSGLLAPAGRSAAHDARAILCPSAWRLFRESSRSTAAAVESAHAPARSRARLDRPRRRSPVARLWAQPERIRAYAAHRRSDDEVAAAIKGLRRFLATPTEGLWFDQLGADDVFILEPARATSLYHIIGAVAELSHALPAAASDSVPASNARGPAPRVIYLVTEDWYFISHRLPMARAARNAGFEVHVATRIDRHGAAIEAEGFHLHPISWRRGSLDPRDLVRVVREVRKLYRKLNPDLAHHVALPAAVVGSLAATGLPVVCLNALTGLGTMFIDATAKVRVARAPLRLALPSLLNRSRAAVVVPNPDDPARDQRT